MSRNTNRRSDRIAADQAMIDGFTKFLMQAPPFTVGSQTLTPAAIVQLFQDRINASDAVLPTEAARTAAVKAERDERATTAPLVRSIRRMVLAMYEQSPDKLAFFGIQAPKPGKKTAQAKATAAAKGKATRAARHTMGSRQKKRVTGNAPAASSAPEPAAPTKPNA